MMRVTLQPSFILHARPYRETSLLLEVFSKDYGRVALVAKGVKQAKSKTQGLLQPFVPLLLSWSGAGELMLMTGCEARAGSLFLRGHALFAGFYLNELLLALLQKEDAHELLFVTYEETLRALQAEKLNEIVLRQFEKILLVELGFGLFSETFEHDAHYHFVPGDGFVLAKHAMAAFRGQVLNAIASDDWDGEGVLSEAKRLMRVVVGSLLGKKKINSRGLF